MTTKKITAADLDESLLDMLQGTNDLVTKLLGMLAVPAHEQSRIKHEATAGYKRAMAAQDKANADNARFKADMGNMRGWYVHTRFDFENAAEFGKVATAAWAEITAGSEHGREHGFVYKEPTRQELMEALPEWEKWANSCPERAPNIARRDHALEILPRIRKKLAAALLA